MTRPILLALAALIVAGWVRGRKRSGGVVKPQQWRNESGCEYDMPVPMTWWGFDGSDGTDRTVIRIRLPDQANVTSWRN